MILTSPFLAVVWLTRGREREGWGGGVQVLKEESASIGGFFESLPGAVAQHCLL